VRNLGRTLMTLSGLSMSIAAIVFAYGIAGWVDVLSSRALTYLLSGASVWVVPAESVAIDRETGLIVAKGVLSERTIRTLSSVDPTVRLKRVEAAAVVFSGVKAVAYGDEHVGESEGVRVSPDLWQLVEGRPGLAPVGGSIAQIVGENRALPPRAIQMSLTRYHRLIGRTTGASWLIADPRDPVRWAANAGAHPFVFVTDNPALVHSPLGTEAIVYLVHGSLSRFDPFSFRTKFSAVTINAGMSTLFGYTARAVLFLGLVLAITSAVISVRERREEVVLFSVSGLSSSFVVLLGIEACIIQSVAFLLGAAIGAAILQIVLAGAYRSEIVVQAFAFVVIYMPGLIVLTTVVPGQIIAGRRPMDSVRRDV
jgi:hypothetical protein